MGGVLDGQPVSAAITNPAFLDANGDDTALGKIDLNNSSDVANSGLAVFNIQREFNAVASYTGKALNLPKNTLPSWSNNDVGTTNDTLKDRSDYLTQRFNATLGHAHTGGLGDGPRILASNLASVPLSGYFAQGADLSGVTGSSTVVTTQMTGKVASSGSTVEGVVVTAPYNRVVVRYASGASANDEIKDTLGNQVYARLTSAAGVWTLSYFVDLSGVETAYSFDSSTDVRWYYQELFNPMVNPPVYNTMAFIPSDNTTADVMDATTTLAGKVLLSSSAPPDCGATSLQGSSTAVARADHTHAALTSLGIYGAAGTPLTGAVQLEQGDNITIAYTGGRIKISGTGAQGVQERPAGSVNGSNTIFGPLTQTPTNAQSVLVLVDGLALTTTEWTLTGNSIQFVTAPKPGQSIWVFYLTAGILSLPPAPSGTLTTEYRTITNSEDLAKQLTLAATPAAAQNVLVDIIGGGAQWFNVDFSVGSNILTWNGYALDGVLAQGDTLRIQYWT